MIKIKKIKISDEWEARVRAETPKGVDPNEYQIEKQMEEFEKAEVEVIPDNVDPREYVLDLVAQEYFWVFDYEEASLAEIETWEKVNVFGEIILALRAGMGVIYKDDVYYASEEDSFLVADKLWEIIEATKFQRIWIKLLRAIEPNAIVVVTAGTRN